MLTLEVSGSRRAAHDDCAHRFSPYVRPSPGARVELIGYGRRPTARRWTHRPAELGGAQVMAALIAVNVGTPRGVPWHGRTTRSGIWKHPVAGPVMARRLDLDGDGQGDLAGHAGE
ncbi:hypothetical protein ABZ646_24625 [Streptomyces sp. NPDC007162]|uniref:hypothetical protein n=2 Tax=unclassified Streptomyces TaxID=2593676 RepID=UPI0033FFC6B1